MIACMYLLIMVATVVSTTKCKPEEIRSDDGGLRDDAAEKRRAACPAHPQGERIARQIPKMHQQKLRSGSSPSSRLTGSGGRRPANTLRAGQPAGRGDRSRSRFAVGLFARTAASALKTCLATWTGNHCGEPRRTKPMPGRVPVTCQTASDDLAGSAAMVRGRRRNRTVATVAAPSASDPTAITAVDRHYSALSTRRFGATPLR